MHFFSNLFLVFAKAARKLSNAQLTEVTTTFTEAVTSTGRAFGTGRRTELSIAVLKVIIHIFSLSLIQEEQKARC